MAARQEADGAEPRDLPTDCPSAVSENGRDESRTHQHTCPQLYRWMVGSPVQPSENIRYAAIRALDCRRSVGGRVAHHPTEDNEEAASAAESSHRYPSRASLISQVHPAAARRPQYLARPIVH